MAIIMKNSIKNSKENKADDKQNVPKWFIITAVIAVVWNVIGVIAFIQHMNITPETIANLSQAEQDLYDAVPLWATVAFAIAVIAGTLGALALVLKKALATPFLLLSLVGVVVQMFHSFVIKNAYDVYGLSGIIMPTVVVFIALALVKLANKAKSNGWLS